MKVPSDSRTNVSSWIPQFKVSNLQKKRIKINIAANGKIVAALRLADEKFGLLGKGPINLMEASHAYPLI